MDIRFLVSVAIFSILGLSAIAQQRKETANSKQIYYFNRTNNDSATYRKLYIVKDGEQYAVDTVFHDQEISIHNAKVTDGDDLYNRVSQLVELYQDIAVHDGNNRIVAHFFRSKNSFPITAIWYIPHAKYDLTYVESGKECGCQD